MYSPTLDQKACDEELKKLIVRGGIYDADLARRVARLSRYFSVYASTCPVPVWAPSLVITEEIIKISEMYLSYDFISGALLRLVALALYGEHPVPPLVKGNGSWLEFLSELNRSCQTANPAALISRLTDDETERIRFLFALYMPVKYGGSFGRYPEQTSLLKKWLAENHGREKDALSCLDAACGSGEGTYELARALLDFGVAPPLFRVIGVSILPLELFAAAHCFFPHEPGRQLRFREFVRAIDDSGAMPSISFEVGDIRTWGSGREFDLILCNGILGGPALHDRHEVHALVGHLAGMLRNKGMLMVSDRFHGGWKKKFPISEIAGIFERHGLTLVPADDGIAVVKS